MEPFVAPAITASATILSAILAALVSVANLRADLRTVISKELEIYNSLPEGSAKRGLLLEHIELQIEHFAGSNPARRSGSGIVLGLIILSLALGGTYFMALGGGWWWLLSPGVLFLLLLGGVGLGQAIPKVPRDDKGNIIT
ncbi:hypothetical protein [Arthrobacter sp. RAF14]|uniref:hypothetical protein n=1 Tax=Arthrobacter sp. RAF14 TaxID=3233051 RepID=UPI003F93CEEB